MEPLEHGLLAVGDGDRVSWEVCGDPRGKPAVVLHVGVRDELVKATSGLVAR